MVMNTKVVETTPFVLRYILPDEWSEEERDADPISAEDVVEAIKGGKSIEIVNAVIEGPFKLKSVTVEGEVTIRRTKIRGHVDWSYATFKQVLSLKNSLFKTDAIFTAAAFEKDIFLDGATFLGKAEFNDITVTGIFYSRSVAFKKAIFNDSTFKKRIEFGESTFEGEANFVTAQIGGNAEFNRALFKQLYLFSWDEIPGNDNWKLIEFLGQMYGIDWVKTAKIEKIDDGRTINISTEKNSLSLRLNDEKNKVNLKIDDGRIDELNARTENSKLNIYKQLATFNSAKIDGHAFFKSATFEGQVSFVRAKIDGNAEFDRTLFKQLANFGDAQIDGDAFFNRTIFEGEANFIRTRIGGAAEFDRALFKQLATFNSAKIEGHAFFNSATFEDEADFATAQIGGAAEFYRALFKQLAAFNSAQVEEYARFISATFEGDEVNFVGAKIGGSAQFTGALFKQLYLFSWDQIPGNDSGRLIEYLKRKFSIEWIETAKIEKIDDGRTIRVFTEKNYLSLRLNEKPKVNLKIDDGRTDEFDAKMEKGKLNIYKQLATFNSAKIEGHAFFKSATFEGEANFVTAQIGGNAEFTGAVFNKRAIFNSAQIERSAFFKSATFEGEADFGFVRIGSAAVFTEAVFKQSARFSAAQIERDAYFNGIVFADHISFQNTSFNDIFLTNTEFKTNIDLRGCEYDILNPIDIWKILMDRIDPYDRQPFTQLEETFRHAGFDGLANDVYYKRKRRESAQKTLRKPGAWLMDRFLWLLTGYGVRLNRLFYAIVLILLIGTGIFHLGGAVEPSPDIKLSTVWSSQSVLSYWDSFWVSFSTFLPVEIPSGADWKPSSHIIQLLGMKFTTIATMLKLAGWILVPVGVAGISGILKR